MIDRNDMKLGVHGQRKFKLFADKNLELKMFIVPKMVLQSDQKFDRVCGKIFELGSFIFE